MAMRAFHGACPSNMTAVGDLDMDRFKGKWYTHSIYPHLSLRVEKCQSTDFIEKEENKFSVVARELNTQWVILNILKQLYKPYSQNWYCKDEKGRHTERGARIWAVYFGHNKYG